MSRLLVPRDERHERRQLGLIVLGMLALFSPTLLSLPQVWLRSYHEHGFLVLGLVVWVIWRDRARILGPPGDSAPIALPLICLLSIGWIVAMAANVGLLHQVLFTLILAAWALASFGRTAAAPVGAAVATFMLALPVWGFAVPLLQRMTTIMSGSIARLVGVTATIRGDTITIQSGTFLVESGCSGINYLMAGLTLGAAYAHLFVKRWQAQLQIVALAALAAILANWLRVALLVVLGDALGITSPWVGDHLWQGWSIFLIMMVPGYLAFRVVERREAKAASRAVPGDDGSTASAAGWDPRRPRRAALAGMVAVIGPTIYLVVGALPTRQATPGVANFAIAEDRAAIQLAASTWTPAFRGIDEASHWRVERPGGSVELGRYLFADQRRGEELIQSSNSIAADSLLISQRLFGPVGTGRRYVREAIFWEGKTPRLAWYWYRVAGTDTPFPSRAKVLEAVAFVTRAAPSELLVLSTKCEPTSCAGASDLLRAAVAVTP